MFQRQTTGSVVCPSCGRLVGVQDPECFTCGRRNPGLWGFAPLLRKVGLDFGFTQLVFTVCVAMYAVSLLSDWQNIIPVVTIEPLSQAGLLQVVDTDS